jgi:hypothetical protein
LETGRDGWGMRIEMGTEMRNKIEKTEDMK